MPVPGYSGHIRGHRGDGWKSFGTTHWKNAGQVTGHKPAAATAWDNRDGAGRPFGGHTPKDGGVQVNLRALLEPLRRAPHTECCEQSTHMHMPLTDLMALVRRVCPLLRPLLRPLLPFSCPSLALTITREHSTTTRTRRSRRGRRRRPTNCCSSGAWAFAPPSSRSATSLARHRACPGGEVRIR